MKGPFDARKRALDAMLVLSGLDGAGKSIQSALIARRLAETGIPAEAVWNRWEPRLSAPLIRLARRRLHASAAAVEEDYEDFRDAKRRTMRGGLKRGLWQMLVWSEYAWQVRRRLAGPRRRRSAVISDRYVYDTLIDVAVNFSLPPAQLPALMDHPLLALFPRPALLVCIDIDPVLGAKRKSDGTPASYLADRRTHYLETARILGAPVVDGSETVELVFERIWEATAGWRAARARAEAR